MTKSKNDQLKNIPILLLGFSHSLKITATALPFSVMKIGVINLVLLLVFSFFKNHCHSTPPSSDESRGHQFGKCNYQK